MKERILQYLYDLAYNKMVNVGMLAAVRARLTQPLSDTAICDRAKKHFIRFFTATTTSV